MNLVSIIAVVIILGSLGLTLWRRAPALLGIIVANVLVFVLGLFASGGRLGISQELVEDLAFRLSYFTPEGPLVKIYTILTATFLHRDALHLAGNMIVLTLMGVHFEERVGRTRFLAIYFLSAVVAVLLHGLWIVGTHPDPNLATPLVGASGAVFGILGAFAVLYPRDQIPMWLVFIVLPKVPVWIAAAVMAGVEGMALFYQTEGSVAHAAHIGGAVGGVLFGFILRPRAALGRGARREPTLDFATLERLAVDPQQRSLLEKVRSNADQREVQLAWLERLFRSLHCPQCGSPYRRERGGSIVCERGHEERYVA